MNMISHKNFYHLNYKRSKSQLTSSSCIIGNVKAILEAMHTYGWFSFKLIHIVIQNTVSSENNSDHLVIL